MGNANKGVMYEDIRRVPMHVGISLEYCVSVFL